MNNSPARPWFDRRRPEAAGVLVDGPDEFVRLWRGFMTARVTLGLLLVMLQSALYGLGQSRDKLLILACGAYLVATLGTRLLDRPRRLGRTFDPLWLSTIGVDLVAFGMLQFVQGHAGINYTPLLALPVLLASVLVPCPWPWELRRASRCCCWRRPCRRCSTSQGIRRSCLRRLP